MFIFVCLLDDLILVFCYSNLTRENGGLELALIITIVLQANQLTKCASNTKWLFELLKDFHLFRCFPYITTLQIKFFTQKIEP